MVEDFEISQDIQVEDIEISQDIQVGWSRILKYLRIYRLDRPGF